MIVYSQARPEVIIWKTKPNMPISRNHRNHSSHPDQEVHDETQPSVLETPSNQITSNLEQSEREQHSSLTAPRSTCTREVVAQACLDPSFNPQAYLPAIPTSKSRQSKSCSSEKRPRKSTRTHYVCSATKRTKTSQFEELLAVSGKMNERRYTVLSLIRNYPDSAHPFPTALLQFFSPMSHEKASCLAVGRFQLLGSSTHNLYYRNSRKSPSTSPEEARQARIEYGCLRKRCDDES